MNKRLMHFFLKKVLYTNETIIAIRNESKNSLVFVYTWHSCLGYVIDFSSIGSVDYIWPLKKKIRYTEKRPKKIDTHLEDNHYTFGIDKNL